MNRFRGVKFFFYLTCACALSVLFVLYPGTITFEWFGPKRSMPVVLFLAILCAALALVALLFSCYNWLCAIPLRSKNYFKRRREKNFEELILDGFSAIAAENIDEAQKIANAANALSPNHPLALFLMGQTSYMGKDASASQLTFANMTTIPSLEFLGLRGQVLLALEQQDLKQADVLLRKMYTLKPESPWVLKHLASISLNQSLTNASPVVVPALPFYKHMPKKEAQKHQGLLIWAKLNHNKTVDLNNEQRYILLKEAHSCLPDNPVIASAFAHFLNAHDNKQKALKVLNRTYKGAPHRLLAKAFIDIEQPNSAMNSYKKLKKLTSSHPYHEETHWVLANAAFEAQLWGESRHHLTPLLHDSPTQSVYALMQMIETAEYPNTKVSDSPESHIEWHWNCSSCQHTAASFDVLCKNCKEMGTIEWKKTAEQNKQRLMLKRNTEFV